MEIDNLVDRYPRLYHMAEENTWASICQFGLLSTTAILDLHQINGQQRLPFESLHRPDMMTVSKKPAHSMMLRDQKPMATERLRKVLVNGVTPREWYELLNGKVFFWATPQRLHTLLNARHYKTITHDVLTIDSASFFASHQQQIELCHMNSGNTLPYLHLRDKSIFKPIADYPTKRNGNPTKEVAEVTIAYSVPDITKHVIEVQQYVGSKPDTIIYQR